MPRTANNDANNGRRSTGQTAPSNARILSSAKNLFNKAMGYSFDTLGVDDLLGENALQIFTEFTVRLGANPPNTQGRDTPMQATTLRKYVESLANHVRRQFGGNPAFNGNPLLPFSDVAAITLQLENNHARTLMAGTDEPAHFRNIWPIPREQGPSTRLLPFDSLGNPSPIEANREVDLLSMMKKLFRSQQYSSMAKLGLTYNGIGRGGEVKFLTYDKMFFCQEFQMLFCNWFQRKELKTTPSGFTSDWVHPELDNLFHLGLYWCFDDGLYRDPDKIANANGSELRRLNYVFQDLHDVLDATVASQITNAIRGLVPAQLKEFYSAKSMRAGAISFLSWIASVTYQESVALGGWSTGCSRDWYIWTYIIAIIPPVLALAGYPNPRVIPQLPTIHILFSDTNPDMRINPDLFGAFIDQLFVISLPEFKGPAGRLRNLLQTVTAVMIKHFVHCQDTYGNQHSFVMKMIEATTQSGLASNNAAALVKLRHWSVKLTNHVKASNNQPPPLANPITPTPMNQQVLSMSHNLGQLMRSQQDLIHQVTSLQSQANQSNSLIRDLKSQNVQLSQNVQTLLHLVQQLTSSLAQPIPPRVGGPAMATAGTAAPATATTNAAGTATERAAARAPPNQTAAAATTATAAARNTTQPARALIRADTSNGKGQRNGDHAVKPILKDLYDHGFFSSLAVNPPLEQLARTVLNRKFKGVSNNLTKVQLALKLIDCIWTSSQRNHCINKTFASSSDAVQAFTQIERSCVLFCHLISDPKKATPSRQRSSALLGTANTIQRKNKVLFVDNHVPNWDEEPPEMPRLLRWIGLEVAAIRAGR